MEDGDPSLVETGQGLLASEANLKAALDGSGIPEVLDETQATRCQDLAQCIIAIECPLPWRNVVSGWDSSLRVADLLKLLG